MKRNLSRVLMTSALALYALVALLMPGVRHAAEAKDKVASPAKPEDPVLNRKELTRFIDAFAAVNRGESAEWISDYFCLFVMVRPGTFFEVMAARRAVFDTWLQNLQKNSFTDYGSCLDRECFRQRLVEALESIDLWSQYDKARYADMFRSLLSTVKEARVVHAPR
jgi:hypothetical protein